MRRAAAEVMIAARKSLYRSMNRQLPLDIRGDRGMELVKNGFPARLVQLENVTWNTGSGYAGKTRCYAKVYLSVSERAEYRGDAKAADELDWTV